MAHPVVHWEIGARNLPALREFYAKVFGWSIVDAGPEYALVQPVNGGTGGGLMQTPSHSAPYVTIYIQVDDLDAALEDIGNCGGRVLVGPTAIDATLSFAMFRDPDGNAVGLLMPTAPATH